MTGLTGLPEMEVPVTEESRKRREMYQQEARRKVVAETFHGHHEDFLRSCDLKAEVFVPRTETQILRCYELIQRANQLNISGRRHSREEFEQLARAKDGLTLAVACEDKFGIYGLVGCLTLRWRPRGPVIEDFVLSCRVAGKRVEHAVFKALAGFLAARKRDTLYVDFVSTPRNGMMRDVLKEIGFAGTGAAEDGTLLKIRTAQVIPWSNIVAVQGPVVEDGVDPVPSR